VVRSRRLARLHLFASVCGADHPNRFSDAITFTALRRRWTHLDPSLLHSVAVGCGESRARDEREDSAVAAKFHVKSPGWC